MINRWENRLEPKPGQGRLYWHILLGNQPPVCALAAKAQSKLAEFPGLHFTPQRWLHVTTLALGPAENFTSAHIADITNSTCQLLSKVPPITITLNRILYHPEAIVLKVEPDSALDPVREAVQHANQVITGKVDPAADHQWAPHVTLAYSFTVQPAAPIIAKLGHELSISEVRVNSVSLITQVGPERLWNWRRVANAPLGISIAQVTEQ
jgi:2'-5' RNA ligase